MFIVHVFNGTQSLASHIADEVTELLDHLLAFM